MKNRLVGILDLLNYYGTVDGIASADVQGQMFVGCGLPTPADTDDCIYGSRHAVKVYRDGDGNLGWYDNGYFCLATDWNNNPVDYFDGSPLQTQ